MTMYVQGNGLHLNKFIIKEGKLEILQTDNELKFHHVIRL